MRIWKHSVSGFDAIAASAKRRLSIISGRSGGCGRSSSGRSRRYSQIRSPVTASMAWMTSCGFGMNITPLRTSGVPCWRPWLARARLQTSRPIYHRKPARADGHLFITVIAYQLVQVIRTRLRAHGEHASWTTLRRILEGQQRVTATFRRPDGRTLHVRTATQAEPDQRAIYDALGVDPHPGSVRKTLV